MGGDKYSAMTPRAAAALSRARTAASSREQRGGWVARAGYGIGAGVLTSAAGAAVASGLSGVPRVSVWVGVTAVLALAAAWLAESAVTLIARSYRSGWSRPPPAR